MVVIANSRDQISFVKPLHAFMEDRKRTENSFNEIEEVEKNSLCFYSPYTGWLCKSIEDARNATMKYCGEAFPEEISGGILADSMGLGKTVEVRSRRSIFMSHLQLSLKIFFVFSDVNP